MKKVLLAFDGGNFSEGAFEFANGLNKREPILLTGVFISQVDAKNIWAFTAAVPPAVVPVLQEDPVVEEKCIERFRSQCLMYGIEHKVHQDYYGFAIPELKRETRFADVLLLGSETFYHNLGSGMNEYLASALHKSECPVILVPEHFIFPQSNILAYDGSDSSVYAIKQFAYLFPELCNNPSLLVFCEDSNELIPEKDNMEELAQQHFPDLRIVKLDGDPKKHFKKWIAEKENTMLISGAFGRSPLLQTFRKSFVEDIVKEHQLPVFIAHK